MLRTILEIYNPLFFARVVVYMLQASEYQIGAYLKWFWRTNDFGKVMYRKSLVLTDKTKLLVALLVVVVLVQELASLIWLVLSIINHYTASAYLAAGLFLIAPMLWAHLIVMPLLLGDWLITKPYMSRNVKRSAQTFAKHQAVRIAVAGSYGKTTMKEILLTVLGEGKKAAATPANKNVAFSHAIFARQLTGDEDVLVIEYGEGAPGDVARFCQNTNPSIGIITGLAPAHLDKYKTVEAAGRDIFSLADYLDDKDVYVNKDSLELKPFLKPKHITYDQTGVAGWKVTDVQVSIDGISFKLKKGRSVLELKSALLGRHQIGPLVLAAALAHKLGLSKSQIERAVAKIQPFEHRMQPYQSGGAWVIDDTYNGNIEGMLAGLELLKELPAKRKVYVTPGLVDQGASRHEIHRQLGQAIAKAAPDIVVLMKHSVTDDIVSGIKSADYKGQLVIENDPLNFYNNLDQFIANGDLVMLQNDWPDQYK